MKEIRIDYSQIDSLLNCPAAYAKEYVYGIAKPLSSDLYLGGTIHLALASYFELKQEGYNPSVEELKQLFREAWVTRKFLEKQENVSGIRWRQREEELIILGEGMLEAFYRAKGNLEPGLIESRLERKINDIVVYGTIDLITADGRIKDWKTTSRLPSRRDADNHLQPTIYALLMGGGIEFDFVYLLKARHSVIVEMSTKRSFLDVAWAEGVLIPPLAEMLRAGIFPPNPRSPLCTPSSCDYWKECRG